MKAYAFWKKRGFYGLKLQLLGLIFDNFFVFNKKLQNSLCRLEPNCKKRFLEESSGKL